MRVASLFSSVLYFSRLFALRAVVEATLLILVHRLPLAGLELVDPSKVRAKVDEANAKWFGDGDGSFTRAYCFPSDVLLTARPKRD